MSNVVSFRVAQPRASRLRPPPESLDAGIAEMISRVTHLRSKAKDEIFQSILMLDIAAQHAREIARQIGDPAAKENLNAKIATIEQLLQLARDMAHGL